ncbi:MBL fold metallo-hydrolase [Corynebacterium auris]|uniref:MBL fold metallo-hydrolase n=1 Tax=Corynebacterium auris TaxID=44750 RepID=UPI0025B5EAB4|nr:MBL fold metallo-hydrolase [Corynebacterium auris]WJY67961.1 putative polyketide biosynthesis zinc-dependent hydrolase BaeB [Corynebacterium auris]
MTAKLSLHSISVSEMDNNCYLLASEGKGLLIDAASDAPALLGLAGEVGVEVTDVVTTHRHHDHVGALTDVLDVTGATHWASYLDSPALPALVDRELNEGDTVEFAGHRFPVHILRGHTPGGLCLVADIDGVTNLFVGDSLFPGGLGKTDSEGSFVRLFRDVKTRIFDAYPDSAVVRPGHGEPTTLGEERPKLDEWWERRW